MSADKGIGGPLATVLESVVGIDTPIAIGAIAVAGFIFALIRMTSGIRVPHSQGARVVLRLFFFLYRITLLAIVLAAIVYVASLLIAKTNPLVGPPPQGDARPSVTPTPPVVAAPPAPPAPPVVPPPQPTWHTTDKNGDFYQQNFSHVAPPGGARMVDGQYTLAFKEGQIWKVDYAQIGDCVWNKNPNTGGNEPSIYIIPNSPSFKWTRKWEGGECKELFTAFYKVFR